MADKQPSEFRHFSRTSSCFAVFSAQVPDFCIQRTADGRRQIPAPQASGITGIRNTVAPIPSTSAGNTMFRSRLQYGFLDNDPVTTILSDEFSLKGVQTGRIPSR